MSSLLDPQLRAILTLLADRDQKTVSLVRRTLVEIGPEAVSSLQNAGEEADPYVRRQLQIIVDEIRQNDLEEGFRNLLGRDDDGLDLEEGALLISRIRYPDLDADVFRLEMDRHAREIQKRGLSKGKPETIINEINRYLYSELGLHGNTQNYYDPDNSYINRVLERRTGIPISLSVLYLLIARRLDIPLVGVGLPGHFVLKYEENGFCAFLDAFNGGQALTRDECIRFLLNSGYEVHESYFAPAPVRDIITRMLRNLVYVYNQLRDKERAQRASRLIQILQTPVQE